MTSVTIEEAQKRLSELIDHLPVGEELVITRDQQPIARLSVEEKSKRPPRQPGSAKGMLKIVVEDDEHLDAFQEYME